MAKGIVDSTKSMLSYLDELKKATAMATGGRGPMQDEAESVDDPMEEADEMSPMKRLMSALVSYKSPKKPRNRVREAAGLPFSE